MARVPFTYTWIEQGKILAGSIPQLPEDIAILRNLGVRCILSLTRRDITTYPGIEHDVFWTGMVIAHTPIPDGSLSDEWTMDRILKYMKSAEDNPDDNMPLYVHCRGGIGRTGMVLLAHYVLNRGLSLAQAREIVKVRRNYEGNASAIDQGSPQREWIDALPSRLNV